MAGCGTRAEHRDEGAKDNIRFDLTLPKSMLEFAGNGEAKSQLVTRAFFPDDRTVRRRA